MTMLARRMILLIPSCLQLDGPPKHGTLCGRVCHLKAENPYLSRCGDCWEAKLKASAAVSKTCSTRDLAAHVLTKTKEAFAGAKCARTFFFNRDTLTQTSDAATIEWMKEIVGCCQSLVATHDHAVGNTPKVMPLDTSLLNDLDETIDRHAPRASRLPSTDPKKLSLPTPARASYAFRRAWKGESTSKELSKTQANSRTTCSK